MKNIFIISVLSLSFVACASKSRQENNAEPAAETAEQSSAPTKAHATLKAPAGSKLKGMIHFTEEDGKMKIETFVDGLKPGPHGFHIHETGDCSAKDFSSAGGHFNPTSAQHGSAQGHKRHAGDLGNLVANNKLKAYTTIEVEGITLQSGDNNIIGKAIIIHKDKDDLKSQPTGNSGGRIACGVIEAL